ncbi:MAG TPA: diguanylate cyclase, partial [Longimicrobium sp.]|nr:diguanylate cyclase [Longimicrobium sp.]
MSLAVVSAESAARKVRLAEAAPGAAPHAGEGARRNAARESTAALLARVRERLRRLSRAGAGGGDGFSVLCLGVDQLDVVDAGLGPPWSEALLAAVGNRLSLALGAEDAVSPLGGGRFAVLLSDAAEAGEAMHAAEGLQEALAGPYPLAGHDVFTTISAGIAVADAGYPRPENLLRDAHAALAQAVARGRGVCRVFEASMHQRAVELLRLEAELRRGVEHGELALYYQPIVCLQSGRISGFEALLRWRNPVRGLLAPSAFLAMAEASGQIVP